MKRIRTILINLTLTTMLALAVAPAFASADTTTSSTCPDSSSSTFSGTSKQQALSGVGQTGTDCSTDEIAKVSAAAVTILSIVAGIAAVIMVIIAAFKYITSGGDSNRVSSAKSTLTYALVGLVLAVLAQFLVHFVINTAIKSSS